MEKDYIFSSISCSTIKEEDFNLPLYQFLALYNYDRNNLPESVK